MVKQIIAKKVIHKVIHAGTVLEQRKLTKLGQRPQIWTPRRGWHQMTLTKSELVKLQSKFRGQMLAKKYRLMRERKDRLRQVAYSARFNKKEPRVLFKRDTEIQKIITARKALEKKYGRLSVVGQIGIGKKRAKTQIGATMDNIVKHNLKEWDRKQRALDKILKTQKNRERAVLIKKVHGKKGKKK